MDLFKNLPDNARVWIYQSPRKFTTDEVEKLTKQINDFVAEWTSHSREVIAEGKVLYDRFIILVADENQFKVSGCSIDGSVRFIQSLEQEFNIDLFDRFNIAFKANGEISATDKDSFQELIDKGSVKEDTIVFNNMVTTKQELNSNWEIPLKESWHSRFFKVTAG